MPEISEVDIKNLAIIRDSVRDFLEKCAIEFDVNNCDLLDIAPQVHAGAKAYFSKSTVYTLDINPKSGADFIADLCKTNNSIIRSNSFDLVVCTEVLEHTLQPFAAVNEIFRILKPGGYVFATVPFNLRIHGPLPDCWRFTEHGLKSLFSSFEIVSLTSIDDESRFLMPVHYRIIARKQINNIGET